MASQLYSALSQRDDNDVVYVDGYGNVYNSDSFWYTRVCWNTPPPQGIMQVSSADSPSFE